MFVSFDLTVKKDMLDFTKSDPDFMNPIIIGDELWVFVTTRKPTRSLIFLTMKIRRELEDSGNVTRDSC